MIAELPLNEKVNLMRIQSQLKDWGRWKKQGEGLGYKTPFNIKEPEEVFDEEICGKINTEWLKLAIVNTAWKEIIYEVYVNDEKFSVLQKRFHWNNPQFKEQLGRAEGWVDRGVNYL